MSSVKSGMSLKKNIGDVIQYQGKNALITHLNPDDTINIVLVDRDQEPTRLVFVKGTK